MHLTKVSLLSVPLYSLLFTSAEGEIRTPSPVKDDGFQDRASSPLRYLGKLWGFLPSAKYIATEWLPFYPWCRHCAYFNALRCEPVIVVCFLLVEFVPLTMGDQPVVNYTWTTSVLTNQVAEWEGFEPPDRLSTVDCLANSCNKPNSATTPNSGRYRYRTCPPRASTECSATYELTSQSSAMWDDCGFL